jgi:selenocysteine-specific elongation factor
MNRSLILGTAGHIDHGKSTLIHRLTGTDPDRLKEEKRRGITIELGFAELTLPGGTHLGIVDVPGHEKFVRHMVSGAAGIDIALLVIAADDGIMVQTLEHLAILRLLGVKHLAVALTKTDLVDADTVEVATQEISEWLSATEYAGAAIVPVSGVTGEGSAELLDALDILAMQVPEREVSETVRLPIDRAFTIAGAGTVVTGTLRSGRVRAEDKLELVPAQRVLRIRSVQVHGRACDEAMSGQRTALNLVGIAKDLIARGDVLASPGTLRAADRLDVELTLLASETKALKNNTVLHIHHAGREVAGRVLTAGRVSLEPGKSGAAQLRLEQALIPVAGDRFIMRGGSPLRTMGGGVIRKVHVPPSARPVEKPVVVPVVSAEELKAREEAAQVQRVLEKKVLAALPVSEIVGKTATELSEEVDADEKSVRQALGGLLAHDSIVRLASTLHFSPDAIRLARDCVSEALRAQPEGLGAADLRDALGLSRKNTIFLLEYFDAQGITKRTGNLRVLH